MNNNKKRFLFFFLCIMVITVFHIESAQVSKDPLQQMNSSDISFIEKFRNPRIDCSTDFAQGKWIEYAIDTPVSTLLSKVYNSKNTPVFKFLQAESAGMIIMIGLYYGSWFCRLSGLGIGLPMLLFIKE